MWPSNSCGPHSLHRVFPRLCEFVVLGIVQRQVQFQDVDSQLTGESKPSTIDMEIFVLLTSIWDHFSDVQSVRRTADVAARRGHDNVQLKSLLAREGGAVRFHGLAITDHTPRPSRVNLAGFESAGGAKELLK